MTLKFIRHPNLTLEHDELSDKMCNELFENESDPNQIPLDHWTFESTKQYPFSWTAIELNNQFIGYTFMMPSSKTDMYRFVEGKITERELSENSIATININNFDALYLCASVILPKYEGKGYSLRSMISSVELAKKYSKNLALFCWPVTPQSIALMEKVKPVSIKNGYEFLIKK